MKNKMNLVAMVLTLCMLLGMVAACAPAPVKDPPKQTGSKALYSPGTYTATARGNNNDITLAVTFSETEITDIAINEHAETAGISDPAFERLPQLIISEQSLALDTVSGATNTSNAILAAVENCVTQAGGDIEALKAKGVAEKVPVVSGAIVAKWDKEVDMLVMGCGPAGISAAVEAVDNGLENVLIIEKTSQIGGTSLQSEGILAGYETHLTKKLDVHVTAQECYDRMMSLGKYRIDADLTWVTAEKCGESIDWLIDVIKVPFVDEVIVNPAYGPLQVIHNVEGKGSGFYEPFKNALDSRGIEVMLDTPGYKLLADSNGAVIGAIATHESKDYYIKTDAVVLATGGCGNNADLIARMVPLYKGLLPCAHIGATGDGLLMATELGAAVSNIDILRGRPADYEAVTEKHMSGFPATITNFLLGGGSILLSKDGNRFMDEYKVAGMVSTCEDLFLQMHKDNANYLWAINDQKGIDEKKPVRAADLEYIKVNTIEELAKVIDMDPAALTATVERWNAFVDAGADEDFGRTENLVRLDTPPYYAVSTAPGAMGNYGGLLRNENSEVLRVNGNAIPGLYVAGGTAAVATENGWTMSHAFTTGRLAGRSATSYISSRAE